MRLRFHATLGGGAFLNGRRIHVSKISEISEALITHTAIRGFVITMQAERLVALAGRCWDARGVGNSMSHLAVARGTADIGWTSRAHLWDYAALKLVVTEAGGQFTDRSGDDPVLGAPASPRTACSTTWCSRRPGIPPRIVREDRHHSQRRRTAAGDRRG
jgi:histidinol-phosphatase